MINTWTHQAVLNSLSIAGLPSLPLEVRRVIKKGSAKTLRRRQQRKKAGRNKR
jgi:hypothetical protein